MEEVESSSAAMADHLTPVCGASKEWLGGHPYLTQTALHELASQHLDLGQLAAPALSDEGDRLLE